MNWFRRFVVAYRKAAAHRKAQERQPDFKMFGTQNAEILAKMYEEEKRKRNLLSPPNVSLTYKCECGRWHETNLRDFNVLAGKQVCCAHCAAIYFLPPEILDHSRSEYEEAVLKSEWREIASFVKHGTHWSSEADAIVLFIFNSNKIDESVSEMYGAYAQKRLLNAIHNILHPIGGWAMFAGAMGCHGDLFSKDVFGNPTGTTVIKDGIKLKSGIDNKLSEDFQQKLNSNTNNLGYIPYAIGIWPLSMSFAKHIHNTLLSSDIIGYIGSLSVEANPDLSFVGSRLAAVYEAGLTGSDAVFSAIAASLCLPVKMGLRKNGQCFGWLVSDAELGELGLSRLEQP